MEENIRKVLMYILKNAKLYYVNIDSEIEKIYDRNTINNDIKERKENIDLFLNLERINDIIPYPQKTDYRYFIDAEMDELEDIISKKSILIDDDTSIEELEEQLLNLDNPLYENSMLSTLKKVRKQGINKEYEYIIKK